MSVPFNQIINATNVVKPVVTLEPPPLFNPTITYLRNAKEPGKHNEISLNTALTAIKTGKYQKLIGALPKTALKDEYRAAKVKLPCLAFNGTFTDNVENAFFKQSSGLFHFDVDHLAADQLISVKAALKAMPEMVFVFLSPSRAGFKGAIRVDPARVTCDADFKQVFSYFEALFVRRGVTLDRSCKNVGRLCFVSYDSDLYYNLYAVEYDLPEFASAESTEPENPQNLSCDKKDSRPLSGPLQRVLNILGTASPGELHNARNRAGELAGGFIAGGLLDEVEAIAALREASDAIFTGDEGVRAREWKAVTDGIKHGKKKKITDGVELFEDLGEDESDQESDETNGKADDELDDAELAHDYPIFDAEFYGVAGEVARLAIVDSEADPVAVYFSFLVNAAALLGRYAFVQVGETRHPARLFATLVGASSKARKGTSFAPVERVIRGAEQYNLLCGLPNIETELVINEGGLSSAEGLIYAVRDKAEETKGKANIPLWGAISDKRLLVVEQEFANVLKVAQREGNTLSAVLRKVWDGGTKIAPMTKNNRLQATRPHINILGHITHYELKELLRDTDMHNGFANRFLWACVRRTKLVSDPKPMDDETVKQICIKLSTAISAANKTQEGFEVVLCDKARAFWNAEYYKISIDRPGVLGAVTGRNEAQTLRLALLFCLLDAQNVIEVRHLIAAINVVSFSTSSAKYILTKPTTGGTDGAKLLFALAKQPMSQTEISKFFDRNKTKNQLGELLTSLQTLNKIRKQKSTGKKIIWEKI